MNWLTPAHVAEGETPDISHVLMFHFYQPVWFLDPSTSFPNSKERRGRFVGFAPNVGDVLTFKILTDDTNKIIHRSVVRPADVVTNANKRVSFKDNIKSELKLNSDEEEEALLKHEQHCLKFDAAAVVDEIENEPRRSPRLEQKDVEEVKKNNEQTDGPILETDEDPIMTDEPEDKSNHENPILEVDEEPTMMAFHLKRDTSRIPPWLLSLLLIPGLVLFSTVQIFKFMGSSHFLANVHESIVDSLGLDEREDYCERIKTWGVNDIDQLKCVQVCNAEEDKS